MNLADAYSEIDNHLNAAKYYQHALNIMDSNQPMANIDSAKLQLKLADAQRNWNLRKDSLRNYEQALDILDNIPPDSDYRLKELQKKARGDLQKLRATLLS